MYDIGTGIEVFAQLTTLILATLFFTAIIQWIMRLFGLRA